MVRVAGTTEARQGDETRREERRGDGTKKRRRRRWMWPRTRGREGEWSGVEEKCMEDVEMRERKEVMEADREWRKSVEKCGDGWRR